MIIRKLVLTLFMTLSMAAFNTVSAEETTASDVANVIEHIEAALPFVDIKHSDFSAATLHLKEARKTAEGLQGDKEAINKAINSLNQGMIQVKYGENARANHELQLAIEEFKALN